MIDLRREEKKEERERRIFAEFAEAACRYCKHSVQEVLCYTFGHGAAGTDRENQETSPG
jgi:hypothetical protein